MKDCQQQANIWVDGNALMYRFYFGMPEVINSKGQPIHAVIGFIRYIRQILNQVKPYRLVVVFDAPGKGFRHRVSPSYKAHREPMPEALRLQFRPAALALKFMGVPCLVENDVEADDVIGTLVKTFSSEKNVKNLNRQQYIFTEDKDIAQLVSEHIHWYQPSQQVIHKEQDVKNKLGILPYQVIDYLALVGDKADNVDGIEGIGPKTAANLLATYGSIDNMEKNAQWVAQLNKRIRGNHKKLQMNKVLVTIRQDVPLKLGPQSLQLQGENKEKIRQLCEVYELP